MEKLLQNSKALMPTPARYLAAVVVCLGLVAAALAGPAAALAQQPVPNTVRSDDFEKGEDYGWFRDGPTCAVTQTALDMPRAMLAQMDLMAREATKMSSEEEMEIGDKLAVALKAQLGDKLNRNQGQVDYVEKVGKKLTPFVERTGMKYRFNVIDEPEVNAFTLPGGHIFVTTGLLAGGAKNEAQLAGVLGHEIAHVDKRHCITLFQFARTFLGRQGDEVALMLPAVLRLPLSQQHEKEADFTGTSIAAKAGYSPYQITIFLESLPSPPAGSAPSPFPFPMPSPDGQMPMDPGALMEVILQGGQLELDNAFRSHPPGKDRSCDLKKALHRKKSTLQGKEFFVGKTDFENNAPGR